METGDLIREISVKDVDVDRFVKLTFADEDIRDETVRLLITHPHIMVYYHCYYVVSKASQEKPELFYPYWHEITPLLKHKNSYHRDIALTVLANLTGADKEDLFSEISEDYFSHIDDVKFMTGQCFVKNCAKIIRNKPALRGSIINLLLDLDNQCSYAEKQKEVLKSDVLEILEVIYDDVCDKTDINEFIKICASSISPKTKRIAKKLNIKYGL